MLHDSLAIKHAFSPFLVRKKRVSAIRKCASLYFIYWEAIVDIRDLGFMFSPTPKANLGEIWKHFLKYVLLVLKKCIFNEDICKFGQLVLVPNCPYLSGLVAVRTQCLFSEWSEVLFADQHLVQNWPYLVRHILCNVSLKL